MYDVRHAGIKFNGQVVLFENAQVKIKSPNLVHRPSNIVHPN
jgi:hypothetical protein